MCKCEIQQEVMEILLEAREYIGYRGWNLAQKQMALRNRIDAFLASSRPSTPAGEKSE